MIDNWLKRTFIVYNIWNILSNSISMDNLLFNTVELFKMLIM